MMQDPAKFSLLLKTTHIRSSRVHLRNTLDNENKLEHNENEKHIFVLCWCCRRDQGSPCASCAYAFLNAISRRYLNALNYVRRLKFYF